MYKIGQFRRPQLKSYSTALELELSDQETSNTADGGILFRDICANLSGNNVVDNQNCYYLRFGVKQKKDSKQVFNLKLRNTTKTEDNEQLIGQFTVPMGLETIYFQVILSPNSTYDQILWELQRTVLDYQIINSDNTLGRKMNVEIDSSNNDYTKLINVFDYLKTVYPTMEYLTKIGIQGPPSMLMCINKQQIRIGKSGIYEINNGINITSLYFVPKNSTYYSDGLDYFIVDFEY